MKIKFVFLILTVFNGLFSSICNAADACESKMTIKDCKDKANKLFALRASCQKTLLVAPKNQIVNKEIMDAINRCDNELCELLNSAQIISMTLYSSIKNRFDSLLAEERLLLD